MKNKICFLICAILIVATPPAKAQADEIAQLILNYEKLSQLKSILNNLKQGYQIVTTGYEKVKSITSGNFKLHEAFLDALYKVSPEVRKYSKIAEIVIIQKKIISEGKNNLKTLRANSVLTASELTDIGEVYGNIIDRSAENLDELLMIITDSQLRMTDAERLEAIDRIYDQCLQSLIFTREVGRQSSLFNNQRKRQLEEIQQQRQLHNINN